MSLANTIPFGIDAGFPSQVRAEGQAPSAALSAPFPTIVGIDYFTTMGIPLVQGRVFTEADTSGSALREPSSTRRWPSSSGRTGIP